MQSEGNTLDIRQFFSVCHQLVLQAGKFIQEADDTPNISVLEKPSGEEYTIYDLKIQAFYIAAFRRLWPKLHIIGEESEDYKGPIDFDYESLKTDQLPSHVLEGLAQTHIDLDTNKVILWIDPIDGTWEFIERRKNNVTTLLGISVNGKPKVGVIGRFHHQTGEKQYEWNPQCYFAYADHPHLYVLNYLNENRITEILLKETEKKERLTCALMDFDESEIEVVEKFSDVYRIGGCESLTIAEGHSDFYVYRGIGYQKWDICAGDAIIASLGGVTTDPSGKEFVYEEEESTINCPNGFLICRSRDVSKQALELLNPKESI